MSVHHSRTWRRWIKLRRIIGTADAINHAIPTETEVDGAVRRLSSAGLLGVRGDRMALTAEGRRLIRSVRGKTWRDQWDPLVQSLAERPEPDPASGCGMPAGAYERALTGYLSDSGIGR
jgi:hypothetical protein